VGVYEDIANRYDVMRTPDGLAVSKQTKFAYYENISTQRTAPIPLRPLGNRTFLADTQLMEHDSSFAAFRILRS